MRTKLTIVRGAMPGCEPRRLADQGYEKKGAIIVLAFWRVPERLRVEPDGLVAWAAGPRWRERVWLQRKETGSAG
jgi:hypothetical protein